MEKKIVVITGGPGFGKTKIIEELSKSGYITGNEFARELIVEQLKIGGDLLPWKNLKAFQQAVLKHRIGFYESVAVDALAFADRGIPDQLAFARFRGFEPSVLLKESAKDYRYYDCVFVTAPWEEIYSNDEIRSERFEEACRLHRIICETYKDLGYVLVDIPQLPADERARFIINYLTN